MEEQMENFCFEVDGNGLFFYLYLWLMLDYWQFLIVFMGFGLLMVIYQVWFMKYMYNCGYIDMVDCKVWCFLGDGEMDELESCGVIDFVVCEGFDNLIFVVNCNLQCLDGLVCGNYKIVQEFEGDFCGVGWNVIKFLWGKGWDEFLEKDIFGKLCQLMDEIVDGDYQMFKFKDGVYICEYFFGKYLEIVKLVVDWSDEQIFVLCCGGYDL